MSPILDGTASDWTDNTPSNPRARFLLALIATAFVGAAYWLDSLVGAL